MSSFSEALSKLIENKIIFLRSVNTKNWEKSRVEMALGKFLHVAHPMEKGRLKPIKSKEGMEIGFSIGDEFYTFFSVVMEVRRKPIPLLVLQRPSENELVQVQRRRSQRVDSLVPLFYETRGGRGPEASGNTLATNLSSTGLSFNTREPISPGSRLRMEIQLPNVTGGMTALGTIISCSKILHPNKERYKIRVHYDTIAQSNRLRIDEFVKSKKESQEKLE